MRIQHYPSPYEDASGTKALDFSDVYKMIAFPGLTPDDNSSRIVFWAESRFVAEEDTMPTLLEPKVNVHGSKMEEF
ncbi:hypothetical protein TNCV_4056781 [Trichonephila clavipes]|nr:hypothetical protein TNCV_4056781 [Trichonephila clavipes]